MVVFGISLALIIILFTLKRVEVRRGARFGEGVRANVDLGALVVKSWIETSESYLEKTPWFIGALIRYGIHIGALAFARFARKSAKAAHGLADLVSHKHGFQRRETKSSFLREVSEVKNGKNGDKGGVATL